MKRHLMALIVLASLPVVLASMAGQARAQEDFSTWPLLRRDFPSTGGNGIMVRNYDPVVRGDTCATDFAAVTPEGMVYRNAVVFEAVATQGGILCTNGRWRSLDGDAAGTTPFRVFFRDGVARASE